MAKKKATKKKATKKTQNSKGAGKSAKFPRHNLERSLRIPLAILDQNAGKACTQEQSAKFAGLAYNGSFRTEISSCIKYGLLERPKANIVEVTDLAKKILRPQNVTEKNSGLIEAAMKAPDISDVYDHYRNENLPDDQFFDNTLVDRFSIPVEKLTEFKGIFKETLSFTNLIENHDGKLRIIDVSEQRKSPDEKSNTLKKLEKKVNIQKGDTCFVMMPFAKPIGDYYEKVYAPAIAKAGLKPVRADDEIFKTGKIIDQIWQGINNCQVLVAELTGRNPNVFYELGLAHAKGKPVVLVCSNEEDVPFDLRHIRVIYYNKDDPFWGQKLIDKIAENILSALNNPNEAIFESALSSN